MRSFLLAAFFALILTLPAAGQGFTYQGRLLVNGQPANGQFEVWGYIFAEPVGGSFIGTTGGQTVDVVDGLVTVQISGDAATFTGAERWLEIRVRQGKSGPFTTLSPRQLITPTPYAIRALNEWLRPVGSSVLRNDPARDRLFLNRDFPINANEYFGITTTNPSFSFGGMYINTATAEGLPFYGYSSGGIIRAFTYTITNPTAVDWRVNVGGSDRFVVDSSGRVGVNKTAPQTALDVNGDTTSNAFRYATPQSRTLSLPPSAFVPRTSANAIIESNSGSTYYTAAQGSGTFSAPLNLPNGAVLNSLTVFLVDNSNAVDISASLLSRSFSSTIYSLLTTVSTSGATTSVQAVSSHAISTVIENDSRAYILSIFCSAWDGTNTMIKGARITYFVTGPD
jgi:hypothetical protein